MHYIIGTKILVKRQPAKVGQVNTFSRANRHFDFDTVYELRHIVRADDKVKYQFKNMSDRKADLIEIEFNNTGEADVYISKLRSENLPNYQTFYEQRDE